MAKKDKCDFQGECTECGKQFKYKSSLEKHMKGENILYSREAKTKKELEASEKLANKTRAIIYSFQCEICDRGMLTKDLLEDHIISSHNDLIMIPCQEDTVCVETFITEQLM